MTRPFGATGAGNLRSNATGAALALALAGGLLLLLQYVSLRREALADASAQAQLVASTSAAAVVFHDRDSAQATLATLGPVASIRSASITNAAGEVVATYPGPGHAAEPCHLDCPAVEAPVLLRGERVGAVQMRLDLRRVHARLFGLAGAFVVAAFGAFALTLPLMRRMRARVRAAEARLDRLAHYDAVTGQQNRNAFNACLGHPPRLAEGKQHALMQLDLDRFKEVNDTLGHVGGDELLRQVGERIATTLRDGDRLFRLGGDEFAVLVANVGSAREARQFADAILDQFDPPFGVGGQQLQVTASVGVSLWPDDAAGFADLAGNADAAMYAAKREGRRRVALYEPRLREEQAEKLSLQADLRRALDAGELRLHYQPQVDARDGALLGAEALLRWDHPLRGAIPPSRFIPIAEDSGLIVDIGRWVIREACGQAAAWRRQGLGRLRIAVNLSVRQTRDDELPAFIDEVLARHGMPANFLELEITESVLLEDADHAISQLARLRARGLHLAIDDFGTGYSSMAYLKRLPIDKLKIDMTFVQAIPGDGEAITTAILAMARQLGLQVVAEGVETERQQEFLRVAGCDQIQGFRIGRALDAQAFAERWLGRAQRAG